MQRMARLLFLLVPAIVGLLLPACLADDVLGTDESLYTGQSLTTGSYSLVMQSDCNLVLYDAGKAIWATSTNGRGSSCRATMQKDGNFVVYNGAGGNALWASNTSRQQGYFVLVLQKDRNLVIYGPAIWATGTNRVGTPGVVVAPSDVGSSGEPVVVNASAAAEELSNRKIAMVTKN
ncbi:hypothetical protein U6V62_12360 [Cutibacterium acnes]